MNQRSFAAPGRRYPGLVQDKSDALTAASLHRHRVRFSRAASHQWDALAGPSTAQSVGTGGRQSLDRAPKPRT